MDLDALEQLFAAGVTVSEVAGSIGSTNVPAPKKVCSGAVQGALTLPLPGGKAEVSVLTTMNSVKLSLKQTPTSDGPTGDRVLVVLINQSNGTALGHGFATPTNGGTSFHLLPGGVAFELRLAFNASDGKPVMQALKAQTEKEDRRLDPAATRIMLLPEHDFGSWLLDVPSDYCFAESCDPKFIARLLEHSIFFLPGDDEIFAWPLPEADVHLPA